MNRKGATCAFYTRIYTAFCKGQPSTRFEEVNANTLVGTQASRVGCTQTGPPREWARHRRKGAHFAPARMGPRRRWKINAVHVEKLKAC